MSDVPTTVVDNPWAALAVVASVVVPAFFSWWTQRTKRASDSESQDAGKAVAELRPEVAALSQALAAETAARMEMRDELDKVSSIAKTKYPVALDHIGLVHYRFPEITETLPIPRLLRDDMEK